MGKGGGGKGGGVSAPNIDSAPIIAQFNEAANVIATTYPRSLEFLKTAMDQGTKQAIIGMGDQNAAIAPYSNTAFEAMNELRGMVGMAPIDKAESITHQVQALSDSLKTTGQITDNSLGNTISQLNNQLTKANSLTDPEQRAQAKKMIMGKINDIQYGVQQDLNEYQNATQGTKTKIDTGAEFYGSSGIKGFAEPFSREEQVTTTPYKQGGLTGTMTIRGQGTSQKATDLSKSNAAVDRLEDFKNRLGKISTSIETDYGAEKPTAPTSEEIQQKIESTPGYKFQQEQGIKGIERAQAAKGMLGSGNTLTAAAGFSNQLAANAYQQQISNLASIAGFSLPFADQQQQNFGQQGLLQGQLSTGYGQSIQQSMNQSATGQANIMVGAGQTMADISKANAENSLKAQIANQANQTQMMGNVLGIAKAFI